MSKWKKISSVLYNVTKVSILETDTECDGVTTNSVIILWQQLISQLTPENSLL